MNTTTKRIPLLKPNFARDYEIALEGLEFAFKREQLLEIRDLHNEGKTFNEISKEVKRDKYEVVIAILHLTRKGCSLRSIYDNLHK